MVVEGVPVVLTFASHYEAVKLKRALERKSIPCRLIPVPRSLSSSCGTAMEIGEGDVPSAMEFGVAEGAFKEEDGKWSGLQGW